ncbi:MAG TPA: cation diffusion facilitator family transporter [Thermoanaerobaculia bacterium]|nr:cation diffusion facilitator family transporter [Thermoanaerobaculia bacterium]
MSRKLVIAAAANLVFVVVELVAGFYANSLALIGDAFHNFTDVLALLVALFAVRLEQRPPTDEKSFGYQRAGTIAAFINAGTLVGLTLFLLVEAIDRFRSPAMVDETLMMITAAVAVLINGAIPLSLRQERRTDVNIRTAVLHMISDAVSSAGIIIAALLIRATGTPVWDPAISVGIAALILWSSWGILRETVNLLLEGTPSGIDPAAVTRALAGIEGVQGVHHLHIWALGPSRPALSCHLMVGDVPVRSTSGLLDQITGMLRREFGIVHVTVQFEFAECAEGDPYCVPYTR